MESLVIGAGNIGRATAAWLALAGHSVSYLDANPDVRERLRSNGERVIDSSATCAPYHLIAVCVPTPTVDGKFVSAHVADAVATAASFLRDGRLTTILVRSTLLPGTMAALVEPLVAKLAPGRPVGLAYRPSFARERHATADELNPRLAVVGCDDTESTRRMLEPLFDCLPCPVHWTDYVAAELVKYGANLFNATKISYFNALGAWAEAAGCDPQQLAELVAGASEANWNSDYGFRTVGFPFGGECLPKDLDAFLTFLGEAGASHASLLAAARDVNDALGGPANALERHD